MKRGFGAKTQVVFCDGSMFPTKGRIAVIADGKKVVEEYEGKFSISEIECLSIKKALELSNPDLPTIIFNDNKAVAENINQKGHAIFKPKTNPQSLTIFCETRRLLIERRQNNNGCEASVEWISRKKNLAGLLLESILYEEKVARRKAKSVKQQVQSRYG